MILSDITQINKKLYTYWDDENIADDHPLYAVLAEYKKIHPEYEIGLINKNQIKQFLCSNNFDFLSEWFDRFNVYTVRSDISRIIHLYVHGGFYCDSHIQFTDKASSVEVCETSLNQSHLSYIMTEECGTHKNSICFQYSAGGDNVYLQCLKIVEQRLKDIIDSRKYKAGQYAHAIHVACSNGMFAYVDINGQVVNPNENKGYLFNYFGHIKPLGGQYKPVRTYSSIIMTNNNTRANNKHWSILAEEIDLV
jgi:hypothetical protein